MVSLPQSSSDDLVRRVSLALDEDSTGSSLRGVADLLDVPTRTLQRRLAQDGVTFRELQDASRISRARELLVRSDEPVSAIGLRVGYADHSAFSRAFRRATGRSPSAYRADHRA